MLEVRENEILLRKLSGGTAHAHILEGTLEIITIKHKQTKMGLVFHCQLHILLFLLVTTFLIVTLPIFSALFTCRPTYMTLHFSSDFLSGWLLVSGKLQHLALIVYAFQGFKQIRKVVSAYLLYICKHLWMLTFRVVGYSRLKLKKHRYCIQQAIIII